MHAAATCRRGGSEMEEWIRYGLALLVGGLLVSWPVRALFKPLLDRIGARIAVPAWSKEEWAYWVKYQHLNFDAVDFEKQLLNAYPVTAYAATYQRYTDLFKTFVHTNVPSSMHPIHQAMQEAYTYMAHANDIIRKMSRENSLEEVGMPVFLHACQSSDSHVEHSKRLMAEFSTRRKPIPIEVVETRENFDAYVGKHTN